MSTTRRVLAMVMSSALLVGLSAQAPASGHSGRVAQEPTTEYGPQPSGQYGPQPSVPGAGSYGPSSTGGPSTAAPCPPVCPGGSGQATVAPNAAFAAETISVSGPPGSFAASTAAEVRMVRTRQTADALVLATLESLADGSVDTNVTVPSGTEAGVYLVFIAANDPAGVAKALIAPLAVSAARGSSPSIAPPGTGEVPTSVSSIVPTFAAGDELGVVEDVAAGEKRLVLDGTVLDVVDVEAAETNDGSSDDSGSGGSDDGVPWWAWAAIVAGAALFGAALLSRRRRTSG